MLDINIIDRINEGLNEIGVGAKKILAAFKELENECPGELDEEALIKLKEAEKALAPLLEPLQEFEDTKLIITA